MSDDFFAPPAFERQAARTQIERQWRQWGLTQRGGSFERAGRTLARLADQDEQLTVYLVRRPAQQPQWDRFPLRQAADVRRCLDELKRRLAAWDDE